MNQEQYLKQFKQEVTDMYNLTARKNSDYSGHSNDDAFKNFKLVEKLGVCTAEEGIVVRITDKIQRIANLLKQDNFVMDEKITDSIQDLAVYSVMLKIYLDQKKQ